MTFKEIDLSKLSRDYEKHPWKNGEIPNKSDFEYLYIELNLPAKKICKYMGIKSSCFSRTLRNLGIYKDRKRINEVRANCNNETFGSPSPFGSPEIYKRGVEKMIGSSGRLANQEHIEHFENINEQYWRSHFVRNGLFLLHDCCKYHNITQSSASKYRRAFNINEPVQPTYVIEKEIAEFLSQFGECHTHDKKAIYPLELDVYFPGKKVGIEHDGLLFHGCYDFRNHVDAFENKDKQKHKMDLCDAKGIRLFQIFEDEWKNTTYRNIWKSIMRDYFGQNKSISGEMLTFSELSESTFLGFVSENSLEAERAYGDIYIGAFFKDELVFAACLVNVNKQIDIMEQYPSFTCFLASLVVSKKGYSIKNQPWVMTLALKRLFPDKKYILESYFCGRRTFIPDNYDNFELFILSHIGEPSCFYFRKSGDRRIPSDWAVSSYLKTFLKNYDETISPEENLRRNRYYKIYDSGIYVYKMDPTVLIGILKGDLIYE